MFAAWDTTASPGCAVGRSRGGALIYSRGYGMANLEYDAAISPESIFHVASISKQFAAFSVALLAADGKLSLDDEVRSTCPSSRTSASAITIRHLMHHTSGLRDQWTLQTYAGWREDDVDHRSRRAADGRRQRGLNFDPGAEYLYSNTGFTLLGGDRAAGLGSVPAGVRRGADLRAARHDAHPLPQRPHDDRAAAAPPRTSRGPTAASASASRSSTPTARPASSRRSGICCAGNRTSSTPGSADARWSTRRRSRAGLNDGTPVGYGWGLAVGAYRGVRAVGHGGADAGYRADVVRFPDHDLAIAAFCNLSTHHSRRAHAAGGRRAAAGLGPGAAAGADHAAGRRAAALAGVYWNPVTDDVRRVTVVDGALRGGPTVRRCWPSARAASRAGPRGGEVRFPPRHRPAIRSCTCWRRRWRRRVQAAAGGGGRQPI